MATQLVNPRVTFLTRDQNFRIVCKGLQPLTRHWVYFERKAVSSLDLKPRGGKIGAALFSDSNGVLDFTFYYHTKLSSKATPLAEAQSQAKSVAGNKEIIVTSYNVATLPSSWKAASLSYWIGHIKVDVYIPPKSDFTQVKG